MRTHSALNGEEADAFLALAQGCASENISTTKFQNLVRSYVKVLLPHRFSVAVLGRIDMRGVKIESIIGVDYPEEYLIQIPKTATLGERPVVAKWLRERQPLVLDPDRDRELFSDLELKEIEEFGLGRLAIHGQIDLSSHMASYFSFAGTDASISVSRACYVLRLIAPHLHNALSSMFSGEGPKTPLTKLTPVEAEILHLLSKGCTTAEIGDVRCRSRATIRNQLHTIYKKLNVSNRSEALGQVFGSSWSNVE